MAAALVATPLNTADARAQDGSARECLDLGSIPDADIASLDPGGTDGVLCASFSSFEENGRHWTLTIMRNVERTGPLWAVPHDEEDVAFAAGFYAVKRYGGVMVAVENDEVRRNGELDPNQIFATTEAAAAACPTKVGPAMGYVAAYLDEWDRSQPVIGLHSNWDGYLEAGGLGSISAFREDSLMVPFASRNGTGRLADEDTIIMLAGMLPPEKNARAMATQRWFDERGVHVIYRHISEETNGCTLADYLTLNGLGDYYNLEVEHGDAPTQLVLIDLLMQHLESDAAGARRAAPAGG